MEPLPKNIDTKLLKMPKPLFRYTVSGKSLEKYPDVFFYFAPEKKDKTKSKEKPITEDFPWFQAGKGEIEKSKTRWVVGLGEEKKLTLDDVASTFVALAKTAGKSVEGLNIALPTDLEKKFGSEILWNLFITAFEVHNYPTDFLKESYGKQKPKLKEVHIVCETSASSVKKWIHKYTILARHINAMRQLQALPANILTAESMEKRCRDLTKELPLTLKVFKQKDLEKLGAGGILAVNKGSAREPRMLVLEYKPEKAKGPLAIIGKGVTFDTGGISLKPSSDMHEMKYDMSGSAAAVHSVAAIAELGLPVHAVAVVGMVENMPGSAAFKPGDVYKSLKGLTIEVQNTDAEGRLVLGDLLAYADKTFKPKLMVNLATLTGAIMVALANFYAGLFTNSEEARKKIEEAANKSGEPVWYMPLDKKFKELLKSDIADYNNIGGRWGGSSSAAAFLSLFVDEKTPWAHLDIAGIGFMKKSFNVYPTVATGYGIRLLAQLAENLK
ncbi:MAG: leucyl aminopeptidase [Candidatus Hydrogenedentota bacterium]|nr:MAG: leucyl aminopeptidase [Candidatus Hydrogenedentota bacterium]